MSSYSERRTAGPFNGNKGMMGFRRTSTRHQYAAPLAPYGLNHKLRTVTHRSRERKILWQRTIGMPITKGRLTLRRAWLIAKHNPQPGGTKDPCTHGGATGSPQDAIT